MLRTLFIFVHVIGLAFGVGGVTANVVLMIKARFDKQLASSMIKAIETISPLIFLGLGLLTLSGIGFLSLGYPMTGILKVKLYLVAALWVEGLLTFYLSSKLAKLAPKPSEPPSPEFLSIRRKIQALGTIGVILWYTIAVLGVLQRTPTVL